MVLGSHNSWSFLKPKKWYMLPFAFMAKCQSKTIYEQYSNYNVKCFDLRVRFDSNGKMEIAHGLLVYDINEEEIFKTLDLLNKTDETIYVRVIHEVRRKKQHTEEKIKLFKKFCECIVKKYPSIIFWCGKNLYDWTNDYTFENNPSCEEKYSSVCPPNIIDDWWPWLFAYKNNADIKAKGTDKDILLIDFVNIG